MAVKNMDVVPVEKGNPKQQAYEIKIDLAAAGDSDWYLVPPGINRVAFAVNPAGGASAAVVITTSPVNVVESGSGIVEEVWPSGAVTAYKSDWVVPVTAFLLRQGGAGATQLVARAQ